MIVPTVLEGPRVLLRPLKMEDVDVLEKIAYDPTLWANTMTLIRERKDLEDYVRQAVDGAQAGTAVPFVTIVKEGNLVVGSTRFAAIDQINRRAEIGWTWIARPWQRTYVNTEAKYLMLRHAFETWKLRRVEFKTATFNEQSRNALRRLGAKEEGILRQHMILPDGRNRDSVYFSVIDAEWDGVKRRLEATFSA